MRCEDADDLVHCYEKALECTDKMDELGASPENVFIDYTGGVSGAILL